MRKTRLIIYNYIYIYLYRNGYISRDYYKGYIKRKSRYRM